MPRPHNHPRAAAAPTAADRPSEELTLAAVERAQRHRAPSPMPVAMWSILDHLALSARSAGARAVRGQLSALVARGDLRRGRRSGIPTWTLSDAGQARLRQARDAGAALELPESPQHRAWRNAQTSAGQEIERFRGRLRERVHAAERLLAESPPARSDAWLELGEELQADCRRLASASHCLWEWPEPDDERADIDERSDPADETLDPADAAARRALRAGRRNIRLWDG
jgi:hypothetical protein